MDLARQPSKIFQARDHDLGTLPLSAKATDLQSTQAFKLQRTYVRKGVLVHAPSRLMVAQRTITVASDVLKVLNVGVIFSHQACTRAKSCN